MTAKQAKEFMREAGSSVNRREYWYPRTKFPTVRTTELCRLEVDVTRGMTTVSHEGKIKLRITGVAIAACKREMVELYLPQRSFLKSR